MRLFSFRIEGPLRGHVCSVASRRSLSRWQTAVRLMANVAGVPDECPDGAEVRVHTFWTKKARIDCENVGKAVVDSIWAKDRGVGRLVYSKLEHTGGESALVEVFT